MHDVQIIKRQKRENKVQRLTHTHITIKKVGFFGFSFSYLVLQLPSLAAANPSGFREGRRNISVLFTRRVILGSNPYLKRNKAYRNILGSNTYLKRTKAYRNILGSNPYLKRTKAYRNILGSNPYLKRIKHTWISLGQTHTLNGIKHTGISLGQTHTLNGIKHTEILLYNPIP